MLGNIFCYFRNNTLGDGVSKKAPKFNTYCLNGPLGYGQKNALPKGKAVWAGKGCGNKPKVLVIFRSKKTLKYIKLV